MSSSSWRGIVLVTGTDTGVGKTWVTCGLARGLTRAETIVAVRKPAESGCSLVEGDPFPEDAAALASAAGSLEPLEDICEVRLTEALAPGIAAERAGVTVDVEGLVRRYRDLAENVDCLLVDGAGGLLVPLASGVDYADFARALDARLLVVADARLGGLNHALLTLEVARARGLDVMGVVINHASSERDLATETFAGSLRELAEKTPILAEVGYGENPEDVLPID